MEVVMFNFISPLETYGWLIWIGI